MDRNANPGSTTLTFPVALRKESVDRNSFSAETEYGRAVALRKESVDRNYGSDLNYSDGVVVALRKESVDRNVMPFFAVFEVVMSLSARRAWIEMSTSPTLCVCALKSLSARRAWIEIHGGHLCVYAACTVALRKESVDRNQQP